MSAPWGRHQAGGMQSAEASCQSKIICIDYFCVSPISCKIPIEKEFFEYKDIRGNDHASEKYSYK
jgi:hypothetical protein